MGDRSVSIFRESPLGRGFIIYALICLFNLALGAYLWFPRFEWFWIFLPIPESTAAVLVLILIGRLSIHFPGRTFLSLLCGTMLLMYTLLFISLGLFTAGEAFFQHVYQRTFVLVSNLPLASHFFNMIFRTEIFSRRLYLLLPAAGLYILLVLIFFRVFRASLPVLAKIRIRPDFMIGLGMLAFSLALIPVPSAAQRLYRQLISPGESRGIAPVPAIDSSLSYGGYLENRGTRFVFPGIADRNLHLAVVESYGTTVFTNEHHFARLSDFYAEQEKLLSRNGRTVLTYGYESTTYGGTSWLADAAILTGIDIHTQAIYDQVVKSSTPNLLHLLDNRGYKTLLSAPGSKFMTPEYTGFYAYSSYFLYDDYEYLGPFFTFGRLPDQYQLFYINSRIREGSIPGFTEPYFAEYILCSSHVPWNFIPPYLSSWKDFNYGRVYFDQSKNTWYENSWAAGSELFEGYAHSIRYSLESVFGFALNLLDEDDILIVIGDHQPKFPVSEREAGYGVPVHVIAADETVLLPFLRHGYTRGLILPDPYHLPGLEEFLGHLLSVAEGQSLRPRSASAPLSIPQ